MRFVMRFSSRLCCFLACAVHCFLRFCRYRLSSLFCFLANGLSSFFCFLTCSFQAVLNCSPCFLRTVLYILNGALLAERSQCGRRNQSSNQIRNFHLPLLLLIL